MASASAFLFNDLTVGKGIARPIYVTFERDSSGYLVDQDIIFPEPFFTGDVNNILSLRVEDASLLDTPANVHSFNDSYNEADQSSNDTYWTAKSFGWSSLPSGVVSQFSNFDSPPQAVSLKYEDDTYAAGHPHPLTFHPNYGVTSAPGSFIVTTQDIRGLTNTTAAAMADSRNRTVLWEFTQCLLNNEFWRILNNNGDAAVTASSQSNSFHLNARYYDLSVRAVPKFFNIRQRTGPSHAQAATVIVFGSINGQSFTEIDSFNLIRGSSGVTSHSFKTTTGYSCFKFYFTGVTGPQAGLSFFRFDATDVAEVPSDDFDTSLVPSIIPRQPADKRYTEALAGSFSYIGDREGCPVYSRELTSTAYTVASGLDSSVAAKAGLITVKSARLALSTRDPSGQLVSPPASASGVREFMLILPSPHQNLHSNGVLAPKDINYAGDTAQVFLLCDQIPPINSAIPLCTLTKPEYNIAIVNQRIVANTATTFGRVTLRFRDKNNMRVKVNSRPTVCLLISISQ